MMSLNRSMARSPIACRRSMTRGSGALFCDPPPNSSVVQFDDCKGTANCLSLTDAYDFTGTLHTMTRIQANLVLLLTAAIWGAAFVSQNLAMKSMGPLWFVGIRFIIGFLVVLPFAIREHGRAKTPLTRRSALSYALCGV